MKLSIITINYNNATDLRKTVQSVFNQTWKDFEYIIIDGGSIDGSVEEIMRDQEKLKYWVSEPDKGLFHAMNKGIEKADGEYLLMLNSGDYLCDNKVLERVFGLNAYEEDILTGDVYRESNGKIFEKSYYPNVLTFNFFRKSSLSHQGTFIKKKLHNLIGMYDENLQFTSDWKFLVLAICKFNVSYKHLPFFVAVCDCGGLTCRPKNFLKMKEEGDLVLRQYFPAFLTDYEDYERIQNTALKKKFVLVKQNFKAYVKKLI